MLSASGKERGLGGGHYLRAKALFPTDPATPGGPLPGVLVHLGISSNFCTWHAVTGSGVLCLEERVAIYSQLPRAALCSRVL